MIDFSEVKNLIINGIELTEIIFNRFAKKVNTTNWNTEKCCLWTAYTNKKGYGDFSIAGKTMRAHRISYEFFVGPIPSGLMVLHKCNNPTCVNPRHLRTGTQLENMIDRERSEHQFHKLSTDKVIEIKKLLLEGVFQSTIAEKFEIHQTMISQIALGKTHKNIQLGNPQDFEHIVSNYNRLTNELIIEVKKQLYAGVKQITIAKKYGIAQQSVSNIATGKFFKHIQI